MKDLKEKVISGGLARITAQLIMFIIRLGSLMVLARLLTPEDFGLVAMVTAFTGFLDRFRDFGLWTATVQRPTITPELLSTLFWINMLIGGVLAVGSLALSPFIAAFYHEARLQAVTAALAAGFLFNAAGVQHKAMLERGMQFRTIALIDVIALGVSTTLGIAMALNGFGYWSLVAMAIGVPLISTVCYWKSIGWVPGRPHRRVGSRSMAQFGGTTTLNGIVMYFGYNLDKILLGRFWGAEAIGIYGRAYQLVNIPVEGLNYAVGGVVFPALSRLQDDPDLLKNYFLKGYSLVLSMTIPISIALGLFSGEIVLVALGEKWSDTGPVLRALSPTVLSFALINPFGWLLFSLGLVGRSLRIALVLAPLAIAGYLIGLPHGPVGVAVGFSTAMLLWVVPHIVWCVRGTVISLKDILRVAAKPLSSGLISGLLVAGLQALDVPAPPLVRLILWSGVLFGVHFGIIMFVMGERDIYWNLVRSLLKPRAAQ
jgi:PST family polysaccharide transporter